MKFVRLFCLLAIGTLLITACGNKQVSQTTGWNYNDSKWGGFEVSPYTEQMTGPGLIFIEGGSFLMGRVSDDPHHAWNNSEHMVTVSSFYMDETEVSNVSYREYIYWMQRVFGEEYPEFVRAAYPDTNCWRQKLTYAEDLVSFYFQSPIYDQYPVVGVSWEQASAYCLWRSNRVNEKIAIDAGVLQLDLTDLTAENAFQTDVYLAGMYRGETAKGLKDLNPSSGGEPRNIRANDGIFLPNYRLPTEAEWEFAALGIIGNTVDERQLEHKVYPWAGQSARSAEKDYYGQFMANFKRSRGDNMGVAGSLNDSWVYTAPIKWYFPNDYGLYHMAGNVSEWCMDVYRQDVNPIGGEDLNPYRGNVYKTVTIEDEEVKINDTTGGIVYRNVDDDLNRRNYRQADNINYLDGDFASTLSQEGWRPLTGGEDEEEDDGGAADKLASPDSVTNMMYARYTPNPDNITSMINNKVRVVKGGSWNDRIYWMQPGTRRYYDQEKSTSWIGFRCAMTRLGSQTFQPSTKNNRD